MIKKYSLFITVIFSLSQTHLHGMENENFDFNSFDFNSENQVNSEDQSNSLNFDFFDDLALTSIDLSEKETQKNMGALEFEKQNIKTLFSDFLDNESNSTTNTVPAQKKPAQKNKRLREEEKVENQSEQKKTCFNTNGATSSSSGVAFKQTSYLPKKWEQYAPKDWTFEKWNKLLHVDKVMAISKLLQKVQDDHEKLSAIGKVLLYIKWLSTLIDLVFEPQDSNCQMPLIPQTLMSQQGSVQLKFLFNFVVSQIKNETKKQARAREYSHLLRNLKTYTLPDEFSANKALVGGVMWILGNTEEANVATSLEKFFNQQSIPLAISPSAQNQLLSTPVSKNTVQPTMRSCLPQDWELQPLSYWNAKRWKFLCSFDKKQVVQRFLKVATTGSQILDDLEKMLKENITTPKDAFNCFTDPMQNKKDSILQSVVNQNNSQSIGHMRLILSLFNSKIVESRDTYTRMGNYDLLSKKLSTYGCGSTDSQSLNLINNAINAIDKAPHSLTIIKRVGCIFDRLQSAINPQTTLSLDTLPSSSLQKTSIFTPIFTPLVPQDKK
ncbi:MAG: hypothetical protein UV38_C0002G0131 [candidate division TM6 bacterium GW2011_GWE2_42_60]|nr:MAG: hypothetical protein UV38_C0002G0131 [candidate division TM6 bacterium GW2011_GWE2_42_60]HBY06112.1 hypothetical protein [Candidatus Dependentiae bacterium]